MKGVEKSSKRKGRPTKFEEYLEMDKKKTTGVSAEEDLELERRLGKKLKVNDGLHIDDGLSDILKGLQPTCSLDILEEQPIFDSEEEPADETNENKDSGKDEKPVGKYVAPHLRASSSLSNELIQIQRRCQGLLNRLSEENVESIAQEIITLFQVHGRKVMTETITDEIMAAVSCGPRGKAQLV